MNENKKIFDPDKLRARVFWLMQYEVNPVTGEDLGFNERQIQAGLDHKGIRRYAYGCHNRDVYDEDDVARMQEMHGKAVRAGDPKPPHWHVAVECPSGSVSLGQIAKWFNVPANNIKLPKGRGGFLDCVAYITHDTEKAQTDGKVSYDPSIVNANFDWQTEVAKAAARNAKYGRSASDRDYYRARVAYEGLTLRELQKEDPIAYVRDSAALDKMRLKYIGTIDPPVTRMTFYIDGPGGIGKGVMARMLAISLFPNMPPEDIYFTAGAKGAAFEGYDGQPVIIWHDRRAYEFLQELGGRGNVFNILDTHPDRAKQNIKYSSVNLINSVHIIDGIEPYRDFLDGLVGSYVDKNGVRHGADSDKSQSRRRVPFIINVREDDFDLNINKGVFEGTREFDQYLEYKHIRGSMARIAEACGGNRELSVEMGTKMLRMVVDKHDELSARVNGQKYSNDEIRAMFANVGEQMDILDTPEFEQFLQAQWDKDVENFEQYGTIDEEEIARIEERIEAHVRERLEQMSPRAQKRAEREREERQRRIARGLPPRESGTAPDYTGYIQPGLYTSYTH